MVESKNLASDIILDTVDKVNQFKSKFDTVERLRRRDSKAASK